MQMPKELVIQVSTWNFVSIIKLWIHGPFLSLRMLLMDRPSSRGLDKEENVSAHGTEKEPDLVVPRVGTGSGFFASLCSASLPQCCRSVGHRSHFSPLWYGAQPLPWLWVSSSGSIGSPVGLLVLFMPAPWIRKGAHWWIYAWATFSTLMEAYYSNMGWNRVKQICENRNWWSKIANGCPSWKE